MFKKILLTTLSLLCLKTFAFTQYTPSGCVEVQYNTDNKGNATDIVFTKHIPENTFLEEAYSNVTKGKYTPNQKELKTFLKFQNDSSWPIPFECLDKEKKKTYEKKFDYKNLTGEEFSETKNAIDTMFFQAIYDSFKITEITTQTTNANGKTELLVTIKYTTDLTQPINLASYYLETKLSSTEKEDSKFIEILREPSTQTKLDTTTTSAIIDYIGQRLPVIEVKIENKTKQIPIAAPLNSENHCSGNIAKREGFKKYCFNYHNEKGITLSFSIENDDILNNLKISPVFRIKNSYLLALPK